MKFKLLDKASERTYALIFETGDEVVSLLKKWAVDIKPQTAHFTAIGAFQDAVIAYFDWESKEYKKIPVKEQVEVLTLAGDIAWKEDGTPVIHAHVVVGRPDGSTRGGHLMEAHVRPTLELILVESPLYLTRRHDPNSGLALIRL
ncbi:MAG TPA: PPC domain-containing DNA-binding protein [Urbifossiella sp.]|nr:PPC domain-containing DNA-binding protein [Urbifossiella sp.]